MTAKKEDIEKHILSQMERRKEENEALKKLLKELDKSTKKKNPKLKDIKP